MGFLPTSNTLVLSTKLTPYGREKLLSNFNVITHFGFGDSDANYMCKLPLESGQIPNVSGDRKLGGGFSYNASDNYYPKSLLFNNLMMNKKLITSSNINVTPQHIGLRKVNGNLLSINKINRLDYNTNSLVNLFYSFNLPITEGDKMLFTASTTEQGGLADTAISNLANDEILVIGIPSTEYGEKIDGKILNFKFTMDDKGTIFNIYSTFENNLTNNKILDNLSSEETYYSRLFGSNVVFLFSDEIQKPNNDSTKSWSTGFNMNKPFSTNNKSKFNMKSTPSQNMDKCVGIAFLDKGFIILTDPTIVANWQDGRNNLDSNSFIEIDSITTDITQEIICIAEANDFILSNNKTWNNGDNPRISEIILFDKFENIIAISKLDRHLLKNAISLLPISIKIKV